MRSYRILNLKCVSPENIYQLEGKSGIKIHKFHKLLLLDTGNTQMVLESLLNIKNYVRVLNQNETRNLIVRRSMILSIYDDPLVITKSVLYTKTLPSFIIQEIRDRKVGLGKIAQTHGIFTSKKVTEIGCINGLIYKKYIFFLDESKVGNIKETFVLDLDKLDSN